MPQKPRSFCLYMEFATKGSLLGPWEARCGRFFAGPVHISRTHGVWASYRVMASRTSWGSQTRATKPDQPIVGLFVIISLLLSLYLCHMVPTLNTEPTDMTNTTERSKHRT